MRTLTKKELYEIVGLHNNIKGGKEWTHKKCLKS